MTPWIVTISSGEYSDHTVAIDGAYDSKDAAFVRICELAATLTRIERWEVDYRDGNPLSPVEITSGDRFVRLVSSPVDSLREVKFEATQIEPNRNVDDVLGAFHWHVKEADT